MKNTWVRHAKLDVIIAAGPRVRSWPTPGARLVSSICSEFGLTCGLVGGEDLHSRGLISTPGSGGILLAEDPQKRIHRFQARAVVRVVKDAKIGLPFEGSWNGGVIPIESARSLWRSQSIRFDSGAIIIGVNNESLRFGIELLENKVSSVVWVDSQLQSWEVLRRYALILGGRFKTGIPKSIRDKGPQLREFRVANDEGVEILESSWVISAAESKLKIDGFREYPPGSLLFELIHAAELSRTEAPDSWLLEEENSRILAAKVVKNLLVDLGGRREFLDNSVRKAKSKLKAANRFRENAVSLKFEGKWLARESLAQIKEFSGVPKTLFKTQTVASLECFESIPCRECEKICPEQAIQISPDRDRFELNENRCTGCGHCVQVCPAGVVSMVRESDTGQFTSVTLKYPESSDLIVGDFVVGVNRQGAALGQVRVSARGPQEQGQSWVQVEVPEHLFWELRGIRKIVDPTVELHVTRPEFSKVEIFLNGERRLAREKATVQDALFEMARARSEDQLRCNDGSCGLCDIEVDGLKRRACQTAVRRGMQLKVGSPLHWKEISRAEIFCPCQGIEKNEFIQAVKLNLHRSAEDIVKEQGVGSGRCHGTFCYDSVRKILKSEGVDDSQWIDWSFPWMDWTTSLGRG